MPDMAGMPGSGGAPAVVWVAVLAGIGYVVAASTIRRRGGWWPGRRSVCWCAGVAVAAAAMSGPLSGAAYHDLRVHMLGHLALGMAAPLLLVAAAPVTCALRVLPVVPARRLARLLRARPVRVVTHPCTAAVLDAA